ncbi:MAG: HAMP domain-containing histidine kinase [Muribaculaceae bacterium]|nr:HAMP domain-containing histidine kinase [Muribaculaceae bacterium]
MKSLYDKRKIWKWVFIAVSCMIAAAFLLISNRLVSDLSVQERERMQIWAGATQQLAESTTSASGDFDTFPTSYLDYLFSIIEANHTIPVLLVDADDNIIMHRNFNLPEPMDEYNAEQLTDANLHYLQNKLNALKKTQNLITITIDADTVQRLYYEDSLILKRLSYYPLVQLLVIIIFIMIVYFAVVSMKKAEQNKVWVGLSKETAHQLGTPISSLVAWMQLLEGYGLDKEVVKEMDKDVHRLTVIADRFSKIGSKPEPDLHYAAEAVNKSLEYMRSRISGKVRLTVNAPHHEIPVMITMPLFEWVMENLTKNAVDAMQGEGSLTFTVSSDKDKVYIDVTDTGKGIARKNFDMVFNPGYTTKKRGWGLGLTLVKRIIEEYHHGKIYVKESELNRGTTFRIELPLASAQ